MDKQKIVIDQEKDLKHRSGNLIAISHNVHPADFRYELGRHDKSVPELEIQKFKEREDAPQPFWLIPDAGSEFKIN